MSAATTWVLLRGLTRERAHWGPFPARLGSALPDARVIALDLPGAGSLHDVTSPLDVPAIAAACRAQLQRQRIEGALNLLGLSLGGMVAAAWMERWPDEVARAVIVNSSARNLGPLLQRLRPASLPALLRIAWAWGERDAESEVLRLTSARPQRHVGVLGTWTAVQRERPVSRANALRQLLAAARHRVPETPPRRPVLVAASERDALVDLRCSQRLAQLWRAELALHPSAGHDLPLDDPQWLIERIAGWLARAEGA